MSHDKISALLSLGVAIVVFSASFFQWWDICYDGKMRTKLWTKILFGVCIVALIYAVVLLFN